MEFVALDFALDLDVESGSPVVDDLHGEANIHIASTFLQNQILLNTEVSKVMVVHLGPKTLHLVGVALRAAVLLDPVWHLRQSRTLPQACLAEPVRGQWWWCPASDAKRASGH